LLLGGLVLAVLFFLGMKKPIFLVVVAIAILIAVVLAFWLCGTTTYSRTVSKLEPGRVYSWKVVAEDGKGGSTESETWEIRVK
jgi:cell division protein FtsW (lipid II flippase)